MNAGKFSRHIDDYDYDDDEALSLVSPLQNLQV